MPSFSELKPECQNGIAESFRRNGQLENGKTRMVRTGGFKVGLPFLLHHVVSIMKAFILCLSLALTAPLQAEDPAAEGSFWLDLYRGEEVSEADLIGDLVQTNVIYAGEIHTIDRHHRMQSALLEKLAARGTPLVLGLEQIEARHAAAVERFNRGESDFDGLAQEIDWAKQWKNFEQYRALCEFAQANKIPLLALNAPAEIIRAVGKGGLGSLTSEQQQQLPEEIVTDDPVYERLMNLMLAVHATMDPKKLHAVFEAQVARDETMAANIAGALRGPDGKPRTVLVVCGSGHINYGLGTPDRVKRRAPESTERILLATESGELVLSPQEEAMRRAIFISHADLRSLGRPLADYVQVLPRNAEEEKSPPKATKE